MINKCFLRSDMQWRCTNLNIHGACAMAPAGGSRFSSEVFDPIFRSMKSFVPGCKSKWSMHFCAVRSCNTASWLLRGGISLLSRKSRVKSGAVAILQAFEQSWRVFQSFIRYTASCGGWCNVNGNLWNGKECAVLFERRVCVCFLFVK